MSIELLADVLRQIGVSPGELGPEQRLRANLGLDSVETTELELELGQRFGLKVDLWDTTDYSLGELGSLVAATRPGAARPLDPAPAPAAPGQPEPPDGAPRIPAGRAQRYRDAGWWRPEPLAALLLGAVSRNPGKCALVAGDTRISYGELAASVDRVAGQLPALGIGRGDRVVVQLPNSAEYVILVLALLQIGAPPVLIPVALRDYELDRITRLTAPVAMAVPADSRRSEHLALAGQLAARHPSLTRILVTGAGQADSGAAARLAAAGPAVTDLTALCEAAPPGGPRRAPGQWSTAAVDPTSTALFLLSSGTTGPPKLMARTHEDYGYIVRATSEAAGMSAGTVYLAVMPGTHTFVLAYPGIMGTLAAGGTVVLGSAVDPRRALALIEAERVTHAAAVPGLVTQWADVLRTEPADTSSLRVLQVGGARLDAVLAETAASALSCEIQQVYGMSEGLANVTRLTDPRDVITATQGRPVSPGDEIQIVDEARRPVPDGAIGELWTRGPSTVAGYYRDPEATARAFTTDGFYRTGDLVRRRPDGNLEVTGRVKNLINRGGEKVSAEELEELTRELPAVTAAGAAPMPHPVYGETVCLFVVPAGDTPPALADIRRHLTSRGLARYKLPERLELLDEMPLIGVGKLDRGTLRERATTLSLTHGR